jgi:hypothetical protein
MMSSEFELSNIELEEYDRQFHHLQNIKKIDFLTPSYQYQSYDEKEESYFSRRNRDSISSNDFTERQPVVEKNLTEAELGIY